MQYPHQLSAHYPSAPMTTPIQPSFIFNTTCTSWEQTKDYLMSMGVPRDELGRWHFLYLWGHIQRALQDGWDPREEIERHLTPFFEYLGGRMFRCICPVRNGKPGEVCGWEGAKKDRTISHICGHLNYNAFICGGQCHRVGCTQRFAEKRNLDQHIKPDSVQCPRCNKTIEHKRNLKKHMDGCS